MMQRLKNKEDPDVAAGRAALKKDPRYNKEQIDHLGQGGQGVVFKVQKLSQPDSERETSQSQSKKENFVAIKLLKRGGVSHRTVREVLNHFKLRNHTHIIRLLDVVFVPETASKEDPDYRKYLGIVMEYANGGNLLQIVNTRPKEGIPAFEAAVRNRFAQVVMAVGYFHTKNIPNRDIKPDNILVHNGLLKVCDFGYSKDQEVSVARTHNLGTDPYTAPELMAEEGDRTKYDGRRADVWYLGCVLFTMLYGAFPFWPKHVDLKKEKLAELKKYGPAEWLKRHDRCQARPGFSEACLALLADMLHFAPGDRITAEQALKHGWFSAALTEKHLQYNAKADAKPVNVPKLRRIIATLREAPLPGADKAVVADVNKLLNDAEAALGGAHQGYAGSGMEG